MYFFAFLHFNAFLFDLFTIYYLYLLIFIFLHLHNLNQSLFILFNLLV